MKNKGIAFVMASALLYGFAPILCTMTYQMGNTPVTLTFFRSFFAVFILGGMMIKNKVSFRCELNEMIRLVGVALFGSVLTTLLLNCSYLYIGAGTATTLHFLYPLFVTLICHFVYHDVLKKQQIFALGIALIGVLLFIDLNDFKKIQGIVMALVSGMTFAIYLVGIEKLGLSKMNSYKMSFYFALTVTIVMGIFGLSTGSLVLNQPVISFGYMAVVSLMAQCLAVIFLGKGIGILGSSLASLFSMFEPVSCVIFECLLLGASISLPQILGCALILGGVALLIKK